MYRRISRRHLVEHKKLAYSESMEGYFCKLCAVLQCEGNSVGRGAQKAGKLITTPLVSYNKLTGKTGDLTMETQNMDEKYHDGKSTLWTCSDGNEQG